MDGRAKIALIFFVPSLLSTVDAGVSIFHEARYLAWSRQASGVVTSTYEIEARSSRRWRRYKCLGAIIDYTGADGEHHTAADTLPISSSLAPGDAIAVEFIPGEVGSGRLEGNREQLWHGVSPLGLLALAFLFVSWSARRAGGTGGNAERPRRRGRRNRRDEKPKPRTSDD